MTVGRLTNLRPYVYRALDRGAGRTLLARAATFAARRETDEDVEILFDGNHWHYRVRDVYSPGERRFVYRHGDDFARWPEGERLLAEDLWFHVYTPRAGDVVVDGGAGIGGETQVFSETVGPSGRVLSLEANPSTFDRLMARIRWNRLENVVAVNCALVDGARPVFVEDRQAVYERNTVSFERRAGDLPVPVEGASLDELCRRHGIDRIGLLKLNIEGAEVVALDGMTESIERTHAVVIACHDFWARKSEALRTREPVVAFLRAAGFEVVTRDDDERGFVRDHIHGIRR